MKWISSTVAHGSELLFELKMQSHSSVYMANEWSVQQLLRMFSYFVVLKILNENLGNLPSNISTFPVAYIESLLLFQNHILKTECQCWKWFWKALGKWLMLLYDKDLKIYCWKSTLGFCSISLWLLNSLSISLLLCIVPSSKFNRLPRGNELLYSYFFVQSLVLCVCIECVAYDQNEG